MGDQCALSWTRLRTAAKIARKRTRRRLVALSFRVHVRIGGRLRGGADANDTALLRYLARVDPAQGGEG
jgi:hypothetical protein